MTDHHGLDVAVVVPPMTPLNAPYAALPLLCGILRAHGHRAWPLDAGLELFLAMHDADGLSRLFNAAGRVDLPRPLTRLVERGEDYRRAVPPTIRFLQGRESGLATAIVRQAFLPQSPRLAAVTAEAEIAAFGAHGITDQARFLATLMLQDLAELWRAALGGDFSLTRYGPEQTASIADYGALSERLAIEDGAIERMLGEILARAIPRRCRLLAITCPFPGTLLGALRIAAWAKRHRPAMTVALGGGFPSTELRQPRDTRLFAAVDLVLLDDAEDALPALCRHLIEPRRHPPLRAWVRHGLGLRFIAGATTPPPCHDRQPLPDYAGLDLGRYLDLLDAWNPMLRLWNEGRWLRLQAAHGCYWRRCRFCDTALPHIRRFDPCRAVTLADRMDALHRQTGHAGFHLVDEAIPPQTLIDLALMLLRRGRGFHWWGNIRFEPFFSADRCRLLAAAGLIAVTGGLESAEASTLEAIGKGIPLDVMVRGIAGFARAGVLVHAYLMYGFPGQNPPRTVDGLELVRQLFAAGFLHAGFYHRFIATVHAPAGRDPGRFGIRILSSDPGGFARNTLEHEDSSAWREPGLGEALNRAVMHFEQGLGLDRPARSWLGNGLPASSLARDQVRRWTSEDEVPPESAMRLCFLGRVLAGHSDRLILRDADGAERRIRTPAGEAGAWRAFLERCRPCAWSEKGPPSWRELPDPLLYRCCRRFGFLMV